MARGVWVYHARVERAAGDDDRRLALLSGAERERWAAFRRERDRRLYLLAHCLLRVALSRHGPLEPAEWRFTTPGTGRPELVGGQAEPGLTFSLSHGGAVAACAISTAGRVGVDVEPADREVDPGVLDMVLAPAERRLVDAGADAASRRRAFLGLWTAKEAYAKAVGEGLSLPLRELRITLEPPALALRGAPLAGWTLRWFEPGAGHVAACVVEHGAGPAPAITVAELMPAA